MKERQAFTEGKILPSLIFFALPVLLALFLQTMYGAVDLLIVGQFGGELSDVYVSAVSTGSQVMQTVTLMITALSTGLTVFVGMKIGAGKQTEAGKIIGTGIWLFGLIALVVTGTMVFAAPQLARIMQAPEAASSQTVSYIRICSSGAVFIVAYNLMGSIFRGIGDSKIPLVTVAIACVLNIAGDLLLVAGFHMGGSGAAIATVFAQAVSVLLTLPVIRRRKLPFIFSLRDVQPKGFYIKMILKLGMPIALQDLLVSISFLIIMAIVNQLGLTPSAGVGVADKLCGFLMLVPSAYMQSMSAFVAQNIGADKPERAKRALLYGILSSLVVSSIMAWMSFFHGELLAGLFARKTDVILAAADYLRAYAVDCLLTSFLFCFVGYFNGCGCTAFVMVQGIVGAFGVRVPVSWLMSRQVEVSLFRVGLATPASTLVQIIFCFGYFGFTLHRQKRRPQKNGFD